MSSSQSIHSAAPLPKAPFDGSVLQPDSTYDSPAVTATFWNRPLAPPVLTVVPSSRLPAPESGPPSVPFQLAHRSAPDQ